MVGCLDENLVLAFAEGRLEPEAMVAANTHARACGSCHDRLVAVLHLSVGRSTVGQPISPLSPPRSPQGTDQILERGTAIGRYTVLGLVGRGGMGQVYSAYDPKLDRRVALKLMHVAEGEHDERTAQDRLLREAQSIARLSHANVVVVHDVGTLGDRVFIAMEFLDGTTVAAWTTETPRTWREVLAIYVQAGRGLAAAHQAGLVHRDFKPQNVMVGRDGAVRVMDFGLARRIEGLPEPDPSAEPRSPESTSVPLDLTRPGERLGTPRYMAPEQFRGGIVDARSDQFAFCVSLYEALYEGHPFDDDTYFSLSVSVTHGDLRPLRKDRDVPGWLRRAIMRGLATRPEDRHPSMAALVAALEDDPAAGRRRRLAAAGFIGLAAASLIVARHMVTRRRAELDHRVAVALAEAQGRARAAREAAGRARGARGAAFEAFDALKGPLGEKVWRQALPLGPRADVEYQQAEHAFETALLLDTTRADARSLFADVVLEHLLFADELGLDERVRALHEALVPLDPKGERLAIAGAPATVVLRVQPREATLALARYDLDRTTLRRTPAPSVAIERGANALAPGSYRLAIRGAGIAEVVLPFVVTRGQHVAFDIAAPRQEALPKGFVYVAAGTFSYGDPDERLRRGFLNAPPLHKRSIGAFLIARTETTYREWIAFLSALPPAERRRHMPRVSAISRGGLQLSEQPDGWHLAFQPATKRYEARAGDPIVYEGRRTRARQDWLDFPVAGVSVADIERYLAWLRDTGRVPAARLCTELEWERAARGADERLYPHGDELAPGDANFDDTYDRVDTAFGPDGVGSHPGSRSPFGVDDLAGNVTEVVTSSQKPDEVVLRGGGFFFNAATARSTNREPVPRTFQDVIAGVRVCADPPR